MDWQPVFSTSANIISLLTAIGALALSYRVYYSQKSLENENQLFQHKMNQYQIIIQHAAELHGLYYDIALDFKNFPNETLKGPNEFITMAEEVDRETAKFRLILFKHASFLPEEIIEKLDDFYNNLFDQSEIIKDEKEVGTVAEELLDKLDEYDEDFEDIINLMRKDLGIEVIDQTEK